MQKNNFLDAFDEVIKLDEGGAEIIQKIAGMAKNAADTAVAKKQVKTQQASDQAKATSESLKPIMGLLQPIANAQNQFDDDSIKQISDLINKLPNLDNGVKKQINQILNQQKAALQQAAADKGATAEKNTTVDKTAEKGGAGDPSKINVNVKNTLKSEIDKITSFGNGEVSIDDIIAFIQSLKQ